MDSTGQVCALRSPKMKKSTEELANVVAAVWRTELIQFIVTLSILHQDDLKKGMNSS